VNAEMIGIADSAGRFGQIFQRSPQHALHFGSHPFGAVVIDHEFQSSFGA